MIRVVLDTNVFVSALLQPLGLPAQVFLLAIGGHIAQLCISGAIYAEYEEVIRRPRFHRTQNEMEAALRTVRDRGLWFKPTSRVQACSDPDDDIFLECAQAAEAHYVVTGNLKDFPSVWGVTKIVHSREFIEAVG